MNQTKLLAALCLLLVSCGGDFPGALAKAEKTFAEKNYIDTVDTLLSGIGDWKESDGNDAKGRAYELLGQSYHALRNTQKALEAYKEAAVLSEKTFDASYALGNLHLAQSHPDAARKSFLEALRKKPNDPQALLGLGNSYFAEKKIPEAAAAFQKVIDVSPGVREAQEALKIIGTRKASPQRRRRR